MGPLIPIAFIVTLNLLAEKPIRSNSVVLSASTTILDTQRAVNQKEPVPAFPVRIKIPKINVDAALDYVSLKPNGELGAPKNPDNAGWFYTGPRPGSIGSAVIDGHFGYKNNIPAVFDNLHKLQVGDNIIVVDERGASRTFVVRELRTYGSNDSASNVFISTDGKSHLNLITCQGSWNEDQKSYSSRLVVFTDKVAQ